MARKEVSAEMEEKKRELEDEEADRIKKLKETLMSKGVFCLSKYLEPVYKPAEKAEGRKTKQVTKTNAPKVVTSTHRVGSSSQKVGSSSQKLGSSSSQVGSSSQKAGSSSQKVGSSSHKVGSISNQKGVKRKAFDQNK